MRSKSMLLLLHTPILKKWTCRDSMIIRLEPNFVHRPTSLTKLTPGSDKEFSQNEKLGSRFVNPLSANPTADELFECV